MLGYVLTLLLMNGATGEPTKIQDVYRDFASCSEAGASVSKALSNSNVVLIAQCKMLTNEEKEAAPKKRETPS